MPANLENSAVATGLEKVSFYYNPKKGNNKELHKKVLMNQIAKMTTQLEPDILECEVKESL